VKKAQPPIVWLKPRVLPFIIAAIYGRRQLPAFRQS
jgi:hypothetical protein